MALQLFGFLIDERLKNLLLFSLLMIAILIIITALVYPDIVSYDVQSPPSEYAFYRGYCDSRTAQCSSERSRDPSYDCSYICDVCLNIGETAHKTCINS